MDKNNIFYDPTLKGRHTKAKIFKGFALGSLVVSLFFLVIFLTDMISKGVPAFKQTYIQVEVTYNEKTIKSTRAAVDRKYRGLLSRAWFREVPLHVKENPELMGTTQLVWALADDQVDMYMKEHKYKLKSKDLNTLKTLVEEDRVDLKFNTIFLQLVIL